MIEEVRFWLEMIVTVVYFVVVCGVLLFLIQALLNAVGNVPAW